MARHSLTTAVQKTSIGDEGAQALAHTLEENKNLRTLAIDVRGQRRAQLGVHHLTKRRRSAP
jgi:hypothetical protein